MASLKQYLTLFINKLKIPAHFIQILKLIILALVGSHLFACLFYLIAKFDNYKGTWVWESVSRTDIHSTSHTYWYF